MTIPERLYKYRSASVLDLTNLSESKLWFSVPSKFNDPFDCAYDIAVPRLSRQECIEAVSRAAQGQFDPKSLDKFTDHALQELVARALVGAVKIGLEAVGGVCCFSSVHDSLLMWSHYAQGHQGFCLEFLTGRDEAFQKAHRVKYVKSLPSLDASAIVKQEFEQLLQLVLSKSRCWEYEEEWRVLHRRGNFLYGYKLDSLTGVYFGAQMPESQMRMIALLLDHTNTKFYKMQLSKTSFELKAQPLTFTRVDYRTQAQAIPKD